MICCGDCLEIMREMPDNSMDTIITDPPYALEFMGKGWDKVLPPVEVWVEALRVAKPGAMLMAFGGTRTYHRLTCAIEDAGWEIRDCVMWVYGSGFPKSHDISKGIDKADGVERKIIGKSADSANRSKTTFKGAEYKKGWTTKSEGERNITAPATSEAQTWDGYGTALKPAWEPIVLAMKSLDGTFAQNALKWGVAGLWIDGGRIGWQSEEDKAHGRPASFAKAHPGFEGKSFAIADRSHRDPIAEQPPKGRWPTNLIHDGSEEVMDEFAKAGNRKAGAALTGHEPSRTGGENTVAYGEFKDRREWESYKDSGSAARFFYCAKASKAERNKGGEGLPKGDRPLGISQWENQTTGSGKKMGPSAPQQNNHPTVKPLALMRYLCRLTRMPEGGTVLDPFMGSGSTGIAAKTEGRNFIGIEREAEYCEIAKNRIEAWGPEEVKVDDQKEFGF